MLNTSTVARRFIEVRAEWKRLQIEIAATRTGTGSPDAKLAITAARAEASTRALAWTLGIDLDLMESPKRIENAHRWYSEMAQEIQAVLDHEGPVQLIPVDILTLGKDATMALPDSISQLVESGESSESSESGQRWYLLDVPPHTYPDGTQTALWSAFLSAQQVEELREALALVQLAATSSMTPRDQLTMDFEESDQFDGIGDIDDIDVIEQVETGEGRSAI